MAALNIRAKEADISPEAMGEVVYRRTDGIIFIVTSDALFPAAGRWVLLHNTIPNPEHLPTMPAKIGVNMIDRQLEETADGFAGSGV